MGMDGLSMANTGMLKESTSADFTNRTEQTMQADKSNDAKQVQTLSTNRRVREKEEEEESSNKQGKNPNKNNTDELEDSYVPEEAETEEEFQIEDLENPNKEFYVKLNSKDDIIELYDSSTDRLI